MTFRPILTGTALLVALPAFGQEFERAPRNTDLEPAFEGQFRAPLESSDVTLQVTDIAAGLEHPWGIAILPEEDGYLVTERPGRLRHVAEDGTLSDPIAGMPEVAAQGQGGLLDVVLSPDFAESRRIYISYAKPVGDGLMATAAAYGTLNEDMTEVTDLTDIFVQEPGATVPKHFGSRIVFDDAGHVFITTGEHSSMKYREYAQDTSNTYGVIVRLTLDGEVPEDNPFVGDENAIDSIWSYGHRNIQGATMRDGVLWEVEHGPKGGDELNRPEPGKNYGWPVISYGETYGGSPIGSGEAQREGMEQPVYFWDPVIAPGDMTAYDGGMFSDWDGDFLIGSLKPGGIVRLEMDADGKVAAEERMAMSLGRVRDVDVDSDGSIVAITDYADGRLVRIATDGNDS
ncbi:glucose dehydrogenase [Roseovarius atlanticus]|uniref:Glucose dehydrogenase n=1 Tax=Roseovarius atlanticus TaxID=1641875 RepID=A0A0T5P039_9RHOB|nr:PQQ-dependent sugar dehydrogenase [Roseovarius atlanticus]KRS14500.1 glucose dehydrogenase [Roseovarius atlanticus]